MRGGGRGRGYLERGLWVKKVVVEEGEGRKDGGGGGGNKRTQ